MPLSRTSRRTAAPGLAAAALLACTAPVPSAHAAPAAGRGAGPHLSSQVMSVDVTGTERLTLAGAAWTRTTGTVTGVVDPREAVAGLADLPADDAGRYRYTSEFELLAPATSTGRHVVLVEAENRGSPLVLGALHDVALQRGAPSSPTTVTYPAGLGNAFLATEGVSYARVEWETGIAEGVPATAQGVGQVVVRDFGRLLEGDTRLRSGPALPTYDASLLAGVSQSAWFVDTFVAEGFNVDPTPGRGGAGRGVYDGAIAIDGTGNWLAINQMAADAPQRPYVLEDAVPLTLDQVLRRPASDPLFVDVANSTDYYRTRASVSAEGRLPQGAVRYDWPSPHAGPSYPDAVVFGLLGCNGGVPVALNPISYRPYLRTLVADLAEAVARRGRGDRRLLPEPALFALQPASTAPAELVNELPGVDLSVPVVDPDTAQPLGGVRFPEAELPLGRPVPAVLTPVGTSSITDLCGNWGGWQPFPAAELAERYGSVEDYLTAYAALVDEQVRLGYLRVEERAGMLAAARAAFLAAA